MSIVEWFNVKNRDHLLALKYLMQKGVWPEDFIPDDITFPGSWITQLYEKITIQFINYELGDEDE